MSHVPNFATQEDDIAIFDTDEIKLEKQSSGQPMLLQGNYTLKQQPDQKT
jgi:hypothetical protein